MNRQQPSEREAKRTGPTARVHVREPEYRALGQIVAEAERQGILVLPLNAYGCIVLAPNLATTRPLPSAEVPGHAGPADVTVIDDFEMP